MITRKGSETENAKKKIADYVITLYLGFTLDRQTVAIKT